MTRYILNSGGVRKDPIKAKKAFDEIVKGLGDNPKILMCFFAVARENWETKFDKFKDGFMIHMDEDVKPEFDLAFPDKFVEQIKWCDVIYIYGGDDHLLRYWMRQYDIPKIWDGKTVAGTSAGSDALCVASWTCDWRECIDGLGILPVKFIPHYNSLYGKDDTRGPIDWEKAKQELVDYGDISLPVIALEEGDYKVFEV